MPLQEPNTAVPLLLGFCPHFYALRCSTGATVIITRTFQIYGCNNEQKWRDRHVIPASSDVRQHDYRYIANCKQKQTCGAEIKNQ